MFHWIARNRSWVFSGVGVAVLGCILGLIWKKISPPEPMDKGAFAGNSSVIVQIPGSAHDIAIHHSQAPDIRSSSPSLPVGIGITRSRPEDMEIKIELVQTGLTKSLFISPQGTLKALYESVIKQFALHKDAQLGAASPLKVTWALVDKRIESQWESTSMQKKRSASFLYKDTNSEIRYQELTDKTLSDVGMPNGITFHLYPVPEFNPPPAGIR
ncbi:MAG: hypothetical protein WCQ90_02650 [Deltaproteobacteria bacterium]